MPNWCSNMLQILLEALKALVDCPIDNADMYNQASNDALRAIKKAEGE